MSCTQRRSLFSTFAIAAALVLILGASGVRADVISFDLANPNTALSAYTGPYATVSINRTSGTVATVTITSLSAGGHQFLIGDGQTIALNVNASSFTATGFNPTYANS